jgi:hypothetical protein
LSGNKTQINAQNLYDSQTAQTAQTTQTLTGGTHMHTMERAEQMDFGNINKGNDLYNRPQLKIPETHQDLSKGMEGLNINYNYYDSQGREGMLGKGNLREGFQENLDPNHLEGIEKFNTPMQDYFRMADGLSKVFVINLAIRFGLFDCIQECGDCCSVDDLLTKLNYKTSKRHLIDFLDQLYVHGLLLREGILENARYKLTEYASKYLLKSSPTHFNYVFLNLDRYIKKYMTLDKTFPYGKTVHLFDDVYSNEDDLKCYTEYFYKSNEFNFDFLLDEINFDNFEKVIDVHGLSGCLAMKIKKKYPKCDVISFENKKLRECAETKLKGHNMFESVKLYFGDLRNDKFNNDMLTQPDCIVAPHILMHFDCEHRKTVLENLFNCLKKDGWLIIMENLVDENRSKDSCGLKISFMLSMMGYEGYETSFEEYKKCLTEIGFDEVRNVSRHHGLSDLVICRKLKDTSQ